MELLRSLHQAGVPLSGFLGPQRTRRGNLATVMNITVNLGGQEWVIPQLTPNQDWDDILALLTEQELSEEQEARITDRAIAFALAEEERRPGTFPRYDSVLEAEAASAGESAGKAVPMPEPFVRARYPGRP